MLIWIIKKKQDKSLLLIIFIFINPIPGKSGDPQNLSTFQQFSSIRRS